MGRRQAQQLLNKHVCGQWAEACCRQIKSLCFPRRGDRTAEAPKARVGLCTNAKILSTSKE